jgi:hypothetical protein
MKCSLYTSIALQKILAMRILAVIELTNSNTVPLWPVLLSSGHNIISLDTMSDSERLYLQGHTDVNTDCL